MPCTEHTIEGLERKREEIRLRCRSDRKYLRNENVEKKIYLIYVLPVDFAPGSSNQNVVKSHYWVFDIYIFFIIIICLIVAIGVKFRLDLAFGNANGDIAK